MLDYTNKINELKLKNKDLSNFKVMFNETSLYLTGKIIDDVHLESSEDGVYSAGIIATFFIPTSKGYVSSKWKKTELYKMGRVEVTNEILTQLEPFLQSEEPTTFIRNTGIPSSNVIANFITKTGGDIYCNA